MKRLHLLLLAFAALVSSVAAFAQSPALALGAKPAFILYVSPSSRKLLANDAPELKARVNRWRDLIIARGESFAIVTHPTQLARMPAGSVLVLPSALVLDEEERKVIDARLAAGDSLLATGMPGSLDAKGAAIPATFIEHAFGVSAKVTATPEMGFLITVGDTPLTHGVPAGTRLWVGTEQRYPTPLLTVPGAGYVSNWSRTAGPTGLMYYTTVGTSRRALLGWSEAFWESQPEFAQIAADALDFVEGKPVAYARSWPAPYHAAMTIGIDALWRFENVPRMAAQLSAYGVHGSFHFLASDAVANAALIRQVAREGHSVGGFGDAVQPFAGQPEGGQASRVRSMVRSFRDALGPDFVVAGLRAPQGATDASTEKATASLEYLVDSGRVDSMVPVIAPGGAPVLLTANVNLETNASLQAITAGLDEVATRAQTVNGYGFVGLDVAGFMQDSPMEAGLKRFLDSTRQRKDLWIADAADVATWWRERKDLKVASSWDPADATLTLDVNAATALGFPAGIAILAPPGRKASIVSAPAGTQLQPDTDGSTLVVLRNVVAGEQKVRLKFD
ncbi:MAG: polysaccharide deacetylase family protein [Bacillota bacterium]